MFEIHRQLSTIYHAMLRGNCMLSHLHDRAKDNPRPENSNFALLSSDLSFLATKLLFRCLAVKSSKTKIIETPKESSKTR